MRTMGTLATVVLVFVGGVRVAADPPAPKTEPAKEVELTVKASASKTKLLKGGSNAEPVTLTITFKNVSGKELTLDQGEIERRAALYLEVVGPDGKPVPAKFTSPNIVGKPARPQVAVQKLAADESWETKATVPGLWSVGALGAKTEHVFSSPGTYRIKVVFNGSGSAKETWRGTTQSKEIEIKVEEAGK